MASGMAACPAASAAVKPSVQARWAEPGWAARPAGLWLRGRGGIGRHARFRFWWRKPWGFKSLRPHHLLGNALSSKIKDLGANAGYRDPLGGAEARLHHRRAGRRH